MGLSNDRGGSSIRRSSCNLTAIECRRDEAKPRESGISWRREIRMHGPISGVEPCSSKPPHLATTIRKTAETWTASSPSYYAAVLQTRIRTLSPLLLTESTIYILGFTYEEERQFFHISNRSFSFLFVGSIFNLKSNKSE